MVDVTTADDAVIDYDEATAPEDELIDDDLVLQRYNSQLPPNYRASLHDERRLLNHALHTLANAILTSPEVCPQSAHASNDEQARSDNSLTANTFVAEGYQAAFERDLAALEKGVGRYLDLKHAFDPEEYPLFINIMVRGALSPSIDMGLRSKMARCASRIMMKRLCVIPNGIPWRPIVKRITELHIDCIDGSPYIGRDVRESHCRNLVSLLTKTRNFLTPDDSAEKIWNEFASDLHSVDIDEKFRALLLLSHVLPSRGDSWSGWVPKAMKMWQSITCSSDWNTTWMNIFSRLARHQPCVLDWTPYLSLIYSRMTSAFPLPLGPYASHGQIDRHCPTHLYFLMDGKHISMFATFAVYSLSPKYPEALSYLERFFTLIANYFHPSNSGSWSSSIGAFLSYVATHLSSRVNEERKATNAGIQTRVLSGRIQKGIAPMEHRLTPEIIDKLVDILRPLIHHGLHSKVMNLSLHSATAAKELALLHPEKVVEPLLTEAADGLCSVSSPHRTFAALKLLASLTPVFLDRDICPTGGDYLNQALELTLPGIDPNDLGKTEYTLKFIAGAAARLQSIVEEDHSPGFEDFLEDYVQQVLDRIFSLLESLEAPPKKNRNGVYVSGDSQLSFFMFSVAMENLFGAIPGKIAESAAHRIAQKLTGSACINGMKYYGALVRTAAAAAAVSRGGSSVSIFVPSLIQVILDDDETATETSKKCLATVSETEMVWRIRMLAQACRGVGTGLGEHLDDIGLIIRLATDKSSRPIYKAGGRLLRGVLEGLTSLQMEFGPGKVTQHEPKEDGGIYDFEWRIPTDKEWKQGEQLVEVFMKRAEELCNYSLEDEELKSFTTDRDVLFRVLRLLHALQRGGRWMLAGAMPDHFMALDKHVSGSTPMTVRDARLTLKRPIRVGFGGERHRSGGHEFATKMWTRLYTLISQIIEKVVKTRPDDGALLYRCLEPIELAHEPFRKGDRSRQTMYASRSYKSAYKSVIAAKRPFGSEGGIGRAMPRFIVKLRIEAHHEMRLSIGARGGAGALDTVERIVSQLSEMSLNDFPRVRAEARGVLTRVLRIVRPHIRKREILYTIDRLRDAASGKAKEESCRAQKRLEDTDIVMKTDDDVEQPRHSDKSKTTIKKSEVSYEKIIGATSILRSSAIAPMIMRDWSLFSLMIRTILFAMSKAERADGAGALTSLFAKLSALVRPLRLGPLRLLCEDFRHIPNHALTPTEDFDQRDRQKHYVELSDHLLGLLSSPDSSAGGISSHSKPGKSTTADGNGTHWKSQILITTVLYFLLRDDRPPSAAVADFLVRSMVSDIVALRQVSSRAVFLMLALGERMEKRDSKRSGRTSLGDKECYFAGNSALMTVSSVLSSKEYVRKLIHTLALDHDDGSDGGLRRMHLAAMGGIGLTFLSRTNDGELCWIVYGGRQWPNSWHPRSKDTLNLVRVRYYEAFARIFGQNFYEAAKPTLSELVETIKLKHERIIEGVKDEDVKVVAGEVLAGLCRGLNHLECKNESVQATLEQLAVSLLNEISGPTGKINGGSIIRLISTAERHTVGYKVRTGLQSWLFESKPLIVGMGKGPIAHLQARRLRYLHSCVCDISDPEDPRMVRFIKELTKPLMAEVGFDHELKTVREEVARCLALVAIDMPDYYRPKFDENLEELLNRLRAMETAQEEETENEMDVDDDGKMEVESHDQAQIDGQFKKSRSRQRETLCRFVSTSQWNGRVQGFENCVSKLVPSLFSCYNDSNPERVSHARMSLSFISQGIFSEKVVDDIVSQMEVMAKDPRWKIRAGIPGFLQVFSFTNLFGSNPETMKRMHDVVIELLSDTSLEVRQGAALTFVTIIRDASRDLIEDARSKCISILDATRQKRRRRGAKREPMDPDSIRKRHGAVLGLSSMLISSPYTVPSWMPKVLVELSSCVNDPPPISTDVRKVFADFMRTHRDEWQLHKLAFTPDELDIVSELTISPSYYA
ncbi:unnamed protein product [Agarophyton chilense]|eukprot:gb/GEZJ01000602.1/.p1 GENE.gb/GEZJ01000602.1/~~gb/GEZJ01000602.1/.p1  ORF type:complete len:1960 (-),score=249.26 gb/GEZJ01000602.1/:3896-9775(-)